VVAWQVVDYLVDKGTDVNVSDNDKCTPLFYAAYAGTLPRPITPSFLFSPPQHQEGAVTHPLSPSLSPSHSEIASLWDNAGHLETVQMLLYLGSDSGVLNKEGKNAMDVACIGGNRKNREAILSALSVRRHS
jgi:ankyrin repeat protein